MICALYCLKDVLALFSYYLILHLVFKEVLQKGVWRSVAYACFSIVCSTAGYLLLTPRTEDSYAILDFIATVIALAGLPFILKKPRFWRSLAILFIYYATVDTLWSFVATFTGAEILWECVFDIVMSGFVCFAVLRGANHNNLNVLAGAFQEIPVWLLISLFLFELTNYYKEFGTSETGYNLMYVISSCLVFISILYLMFRVFRLVYTQNSIMKQLNDHLAYESSRIKSDEVLRRFRHDFKNHVIVLNAMLEQGDYEKAKGYFSSVSEEFTGKQSSFSTGNSVVDSLLSIKVVTAAMQNTEILFDGVIPERGIEPKDMCICFGNLLDNAIEACAALPEETERTIRIQAIPSNNVLVLSFVNPATQKSKTAFGQLPQTTKKDVKVHGIGLKNVRDIAKKYNGALHLSSENGTFTAELLLECSAVSENS